MSSTQTPSPQPPAPPDLVWMVQVVALTNPGFIRMRGHPEFKHWAEDLIRLTENDHLGPLGEVAREVAAAGLRVGDDTTLGTIFEPLRRRARDLDMAMLLNACSLCERVAEESPHAAFVLAWLALCAWVIGAPARGDDLYSAGVGGTHLAHPGWLNLPYACATISLRLDGIHGARLLVDEAYEVLVAAMRHDGGPWHPFELDYGPWQLLETAIARYRELGRRIASKYEIAVHNLADDLYDSCEPTEPNFRAEVGALLWSLGLLPEAHAFLSSPNRPSRSFLRRLVRESLQCVPDDPLIQYVWLEMKDRPPLDLREHEALFAIINHQWDQWSADYFISPVFGAPASRIYAQTLISLLRDTITEEQAIKFLQAFDWLTEAKWEIPPRGFIWQRLYMLRHVLGQRFGYYNPEFTEEALVENLQRRIEEAREQREAAEVHPEWPEILGRISLPVFELIERCLSDDSALPWPKPARYARIVDTIERFRSGALFYWLTVNPPLRSVKTDARDERLRQAEQKLIEWFRGAYFMVLRSTLPFRYSWHYLDDPTLLLLFRDDPGMRKRFYSPDVARQEMEEIKKQLAGVGNKPSSIRPGPRGRRREPAATLKRLVEAINQHTSGNKR